jgi:hypothetical protein
MTEEYESDTFPYLSSRNHKHPSFNSVARSKKFEAPKLHRKAEDILSSINNNFTLLLQPFYKTFNHNFNL